VAQARHFVTERVAYDVFLTLAAGGLTLFTAVAIVVWLYLARRNRDGR
jgi:hypothetical protein